MRIDCYAALVIAGLAALSPLAGQADTAPAPGDAAKGKQYFEQAGCGWCHANGGRTPGKGPKLENTARSNSFIMFRIKHGKEGAMPAFGKSFNDAQIADIIAYIRSLKD
jgi:mono/diheme cytochrome c family protein